MSGKMEGTQVNENGCGGHHDHQHEHDHHHHHGGSRVIMGSSDGHILGTMPYDCLYPGLSACGCDEYGAVHERCFCFYQRKWRRSAGDQSKSERYQFYSHTEPGGDRDFPFGKSGEYRVRCFKGEVQTAGCSRWDRFSIAERGSGGIYGVFCG